MKFVIAQVDPLTKGVAFYPMEASSKLEAYHVQFPETAAFESEKIVESYFGGMAMKTGIYEIPCQCRG